jgi:hypothetical protein
MGLKVSNELECSGRRIFARLEGKVACYWYVGAEESIPQGLKPACVAACEAQG